MAKVVGQTRSSDQAILLFVDVREVIKDGVVAESLTQFSFYYSIFNFYFLLFVYLCMDDPCQIVFYGNLYNQCFKWFYITCKLQKSLIVVP